MPENFDDAKTNVLPTIGDLIDLPDNVKEAYVVAKLRKDTDGNEAYGYSVTIRKQDGAWKLNHRQKGGLRVILNQQPTGPVKRIRITYYCNSKTCCFGEAVEIQETKPQESDNNNETNN